MLSVETLPKMRTTEQEESHIGSTLVVSLHLRSQVQIVVEGCSKVKFC